MVPTRVQTEAAARTQTALELERMRWLRRHGMLERLPDPQFDRIVEAAAAALGRPFAGLTLMDEKRLAIKAHVGSFPLDIPRAGSPCDAVVSGGRALVLADAQADPRFATFVLMARDPAFRYWSGVPVSTADGHIVGALWVADTAADVSPANERRTLAELAALVQLHLLDIEMRRAQRRDRQIANSLDRAEHLTCWLIAPDGTLRSWNAAAATILALPAGEAIGRKFWELPLGVTDDVFDAIMRVLAGGAVHTEITLRARNGRRVDLSLRWSPVFDADGNIEAILGTGAEVTARNRAHERNRRRIKVLECVTRFEPLSKAMGLIVGTIETLLPGSAAMIDIVRDEHFERVSRSTKLPPCLEVPLLRPVVLRDRPDCAAGVVLRNNLQRFSTDLMGDEIWRAQSRELEAHGCGSAWCFPISTDGRCIGVVTILVPECRTPNETELSELESAATLIAVIVGRYDDHARLVQLAHFDPLTGLANRSVAYSKLREALEMDALTGRRSAVALCDLNGFKKLNDTFGHHAGDRVLQSVARSLQASLGPRGTVARMSGDEFLLILDGVDSVAEANLRVERALAACRVGTIVDGHRIIVEASAGISFSSAENCEPERLIREADRAMYVAKRSGISYAFFTNEMLSCDEFQTAELARDLAAAVEQHLLFVDYQPEVDLRDGRLVGIEALVRWNHPRLGRISPEVFIPIAEATNQIVRIGDFVLETALRDAARWQRADRPLRVAVNVSARQLERRGFAGSVLDAIARAGFDRNCVDLEIAERLVVNSSPETSAALRALKAAGPRIVVDDFGSGHANLTYLRDFPLDVLKLDRSFSAPLGSEEELAGRAVVAGLVTMARMMGVRIVAEGVDLPAQLRSVRELGCDAVQGDLIVSAVSAEEMGRLIAEDRSLLPSHPE